MIRFVLSLAVLLPALVIAAPVPKGASARKLSEVYGELTDSQSACECKMVKGDLLRVTVPTSAPVVEANHPNTAAPLVAKSIEGDFVATVRVSHAFSKTAGKAEGAKRDTAVAAGLALTVDGDRNAKFAFVHRQQKKDDKWVSNRYAQVMHRGGGSGSGSGGTTLEEKPVYLRLTRTGDMMKCETSVDGTKWQPFSTLNAKGFSPVVNIGPTAFQSTDAEYVAEFDQYEVKVVTEEKK